MLVAPNSAGEAIFESSFLWVSEQIILLTIMAWTSCNCEGLREYPSCLPIALLKIISRACGLIDMPTLSETIYDLYFPSHNSYTKHALVHIKFNYWVHNWHDKTKLNIFMKFPVNCMKQEQFPLSASASHKPTGSVSSCKYWHDLWER